MTKVKSLAPPPPKKLPKGAGEGTDHEEDDFGEDPSNPKKRKFTARNKETDFYYWYDVELKGPALDAIARIQRGETSLNYLQKLEPLLFHSKQYVDQLMSSSSPENAVFQV